MNKRYEQYCLASPTFYDSQYSGHVRARDDVQDGSFAIFSFSLPPMWHRTRLGDWMINKPPGQENAAQGWKILVPACLGNADQTLTRIWHYCVLRGIYSKYVPNRLAVLIRNAKYAPRGSSGKVVTTYPVDDETCERTLDELLLGRAGPYDDRMLTGY